MKKCFGYIRVSTVKQGEGVSLEAQKEAIQVFSERNDIEIIKWFEEKVTAAKKGRPLFNAMMQQLKKRHAAGLVVRRQGFWFQRLRNLSEYLAHLVSFIMRRTCGVASAGFRVFCV